MSPHVLAVDLFALLMAVTGFHLAFRQHLVRRWWRALAPRDPAKPPRKAHAAGADQDPAHYALIIFGMMMLAFGLILGCFATAYSLMTAHLPS